MRYNVEWSFYIESEHLVKFSLLWLFWIFISIDDVPLLMNGLAILIDSNVLVLLILTLINFYDLFSLNIGDE